MALAALKHEFQLKNFGFTDCEPERFYKSQWFDKIWIFCLIKFVLFGYWFGWFIASLIVPIQIDRWWIFLTNWGVVVLVFYFLISFLLSLYGLYQSLNSQTGPRQHELSTVSQTVISSSKSYQVNCAINRTGLQWFHKIVWIFHTIAFGIAIIITIAYWTLLDANFSSLSINTHLINSIITLIDLFICKIPIRILHFYHLCLCTVVYTIFSLILHGAGYESSIYPVLDWADGAGFAIGLVLIIILVAAPIAHMLVFGIYKLRVFIASTCITEPQNQSQQPATVNQEDEEIKGIPNESYIDLE